MHCLTHFLVYRSDIGNVRVRPTSALHFLANLCPSEKVAVCLQLLLLQKKKSHNTAVQKRPRHFCIVLFWKKINNTHLERNMISNTTAERARHPSGIHGDGYVLVAVESGECIAQFTCLFSSWVPYVARRVWNQWGVCEEGAVREFAWTSEPQRGKVFTSDAYQSPSSALCLSLSLRYLIRSDPLAHVPEEPPLHSSSLKERRESSTDTREDTQLW